jgi:hypothetical protein
MGMGNLIKYIRYEISHVAPDLSEADAKVNNLISIETNTRFRTIE